jgi:glycosyltransferase involved in cell wall biosynthesis
MKIALIHDDFMQSGGAESLFATIASLFPKAPVYTSLVNWNKLPKTIDKGRVRVSFMQKIPFAKNLYKALLPLYALAFETFDFSGFDVVISSTTRFAKSTLTKPGTVHICYINSTPRFLWDENVEKQYLPGPFRFLFSPVFSWLKRWDKASSSRPDFYIANSKNVKNRVTEYYNRGSDVIYPFADIGFYDIARIHNWELKSADYFLIVSRLVKWKRIDIAIEASALIHKNIKIVGSGPDRSRLQKLALAKNAQVEFLGKITREQLRDLYQNCRALIVTQEEDFGIAAVEAQACGAPVIAYASGGAQETVKEGKTGIMFRHQTAKSIKDAMLACLEVKWTKAACRKNSLKFSQAQFVRNIKEKVKEYASKPS